MPELPEVENQFRFLKEKFHHQRLKKIVFSRDNIRYPLEKKELRQIFAAGESFQCLYRHGKKILLGSSRGKVEVGLGMTGSFLVKQHSDPVEKHEHLSLVFENGVRLGFSDPRRFGFWKVLDDESRFFIGVNPLSGKDLEALFVEVFNKSSLRNVKAFLMDQRAIAGLGNIYVLEALFKAKVHPLQACATVSLRQWKALAKCIPPILERAIASGGSSIRSYSNVDGKQGGFQQEHFVYNREGEGCKLPKCQGAIERIPQGGRSSWFCNRCQKLEGNA